MAVMNTEVASWGITGDFDEVVLHWRRLRPEYVHALIAMQEQGGLWPPWPTSSIPERLVQPMGRDFHIPRLDATAVEPWLAIEQKLSLILAMAVDTGEEGWVFGHCTLRGSSLIFWETSPLVQAGELLEVFITLLAGFPLQVRAVVRILNVRDEKPDGARIHCRLLATHPAWMPKEAASERPAATPTPPQSPPPPSGRNRGPGGGWGPCEG